MILIVTILIGCAHSVNQLSFVATVLENDETYLLVKPEEGSDELRSADRITVSIRDTVLLNSQDIEIAASFRANPPNIRWKSPFFLVVSKSSRTTRAPGNSLISSLSTRWIPTPKKRSFFVLPQEGQDAGKLLMTLQ